MTTIVSVFQKWNAIISTYFFFFSSFCERFRLLNVSFVNGYVNERTIVDIGTEKKQQFILIRSRPSLLLHPSSFGVCLTNDACQEWIGEQFYFNLGPPSYSAYIYIYIYPQRGIIHWTLSFVISADIKIKTSLVVRIYSAQ